MLGDSKTLAAVVLKAKVKPAPEPEPDLDPLEVAAEELLAAVEAKDTKGVAEALRSAFDICAHSPIADDE